MKRSIIVLLLLCSPVMLLAASSDGADITLEKVTINTNDRASVLRGAKFYAQNCMVCHTMRYLQHNALAKEAGVTLDKMPLNNKNWWLGIVPPDLTLIAKVRTPDWLYTYLHAFYKDPSRPTGSNNLLMPNVNMTNVLRAFQGEQVRINPVNSDFSKPRYYTLLKLENSGSMTPEQFNQAMTDLVNFLVYASDPGQVQRHHIGFWVLLFLAILFVLAYFLQKIYWRKQK